MELRLYNVLNVGERQGFNIKAEMKLKILSVIERYQMLHLNATVIVALSGGADSMTLLHFLNSIKDEYNLKLIAAHVNHGLRGDEALRDENFVIDYCNKIGVEIKVLHSDIRNISLETGESIEECGRRIRYEFFEKIDEETIIATAHTLSDNMETMLFNLSRGASLKGLCGIPPKRGRIIRPMIEISRREVESYCQENDIPFVIDSTNLQTEYSRNLIRLNVIPNLYKINPSLDSSMQRCINNLKDDEDYLLTLSMDILVKSKINDRTYDAQLIANNHISIRRRIISAILYDKTSIIPELKHIDSVDSILFKGGKTQVQTGLSLRVRAGKLEFPEYDKDIGHWESKVIGNIAKTPIGEVETSIIYKKNTDNLKKINKEMLENCLDYDKIKDDYFFRSRMDGDVFKKSGRNITKSLKKLFNENNIPPEKRNEKVILCDKNGILWIDGFGVDERAAVTEATERILVINLRRTK